MYEVRVESHFCAAHFLRDYHGACENLHGHNYRVYAHVRGALLDEGGMLIDFVQLDAALRTVCAELDHSNLNDLEAFAGNPSAERIAFYLYSRLVSVLGEQGIDVGRAASGSDGARAELYALDVFETERSRARYCIDD